MQVLGQPKGTSIGDVNAIEESQKVEYAEEGDNTQVNLRHEFLLSRMRRADDVQFVVLVLDVGEIGIIVIINLILGPWLSIDL